MTRCRCINAFFFACPVEPTRCGAAHSKYSGKREHQCGEDAVYLKTETKPFTQKAYFIAFSRGTSIIVALASPESPKPCTIHVSSTFKKHVITRLNYLASERAY